MRPQPHSRHSSQHPAPSWFSARRSAILRAAQLHIRHIVPWPALRASSELVLPSTSRPAQQTCPSACPCPGSSPITHRIASPITHTAARSESARLSALRGGCCRFVVRSAGFPRQQTCDDRLGCGGILTAAGLCSWRCSFVSGCRMRCRRQCDVRATAKASDGMLLSGVPIPGCRSQDSATWAHFCISGNRPRAVANRRQREGHWLPNSVTALGGPAASIQLRQGPRAAGGPRESAHCPGPAQRSAGPAARCAAAAGLQPAKRAAGGLEPTPGRCCGLGPCASPGAVVSDRRLGAASPPNGSCRVLTRAACRSCMLRYQARQLRWRKRRVAAASSGLVCARLTLLGASFACDFDPSVPDATQVRRRDAACRKLCRMREFNADICAKL
jgi:hypothetical protein